MFGIDHFSLFVLSCVLLNIAPGQDTLYIIGRSAAQGRGAGLVSAMGVMTGVLAHTLFAALGLSVVLATSAPAFNSVKYAGAVYLVWMGIQFFRKGGGRLQGVSRAANPMPLGRLYRQGVLTNVLNPKVALFFMSFLPQFITPDAPYVFLSFMVLGLVLFATGSLWCICLVFGADWVRRRFGGKPGAGGTVRKLTGALFIGLGIKLALTRSGA